MRDIHRRKAGPFGPPTLLPLVALSHFWRERAIGPDSSGRAARLVCANLHVLWKSFEQSGVQGPSDLGVYMDWCATRSPASDLASVTASEAGDDGTRDSTPLPFAGAELGTCLSADMSMLPNEVHTHAHTHATKPVEAIGLWYTHIGVTLWLVTETAETKRAGLIALTHEGFGRYRQRPLSLSRFQRESFGL